MLTKEEAEKLIDAIREILCLSKGMNSECRDKIKHLYSITGSLIEKPKRRIKIGDIYKDGEGVIKQINEIDYGDNSMQSSDAWNYKLNGEPLGTFPDEKNLDLSRRYKLVEIEE